MSTIGTATGNGKKPKKDAFAAMKTAQETSKKIKPKKRNQEKKLRTYFPQKKNHQGFPMKDCKFQPSEGAYMYQPWWYGQSYATDPATEGMPPVYCKHCKLSPCLAVESESNLSGLGIHMLEEHRQSPRWVRNDIAHRLEMKRRRVFQLDLFRGPMVHTQCVKDFCNIWFPDVEKESDEE